MNLTKKQQIQVSLIVLCVIIFFWQLYKLFSSPAVEMPPVVPQTTAPKESGLAYPTPKATAANKADAPVAALEGPGVEYTRLSSELQIIQMQRAIAESYEAIAVAKRNTAKALADTAQIMGNNAALPGSIAMETPHLNNEYELIYTGQEGGQWTATLKKNNQTFDIVPNTVLGNMKVISIDDNGVTVKQGNEHKIISFNGIIPVNDEPAQETAALESVAKSVAPVLKMPVPLELSQGANDPKVSTTAPVPAQATVTTQAIDNKLQPVVASTANNPTPVVKPAAAPVEPATVVQPGPSLPNKATVSAQAMKPIEGKAAAPFVTEASDDVKQDGQKLTEVKQGVSAENSKLATLNPTHYTIQIMADNNAVALSKFVKDHKIGDKAMIVKTKRNGKDWYVLLYGDYPNSFTANAAIDNLNDNLLEWDPFVRKIGSVQTNTAK